MAVFFKISVQPDLVLSFLQFMIAAPYHLLFWELLALIMICLVAISEAERKAKEEERTETSTLLPSKKA